MELFHAAERQVRGDERILSVRGARLPPVQKIEHHNRTYRKNDQGKDRLKKAKPLPIAQARRNRLRCRCHWSQKYPQPRYR